MLKKFKFFILGFLTCGILFTGTIGIMAAPLDSKISATLMGSIKMKLFGKDFKPKMADGNYVKPVSYNGKLYLPVDVISDYLGTPVEWEAKSKTLWLGGKTQNVPVKDSSLYKDYYGTIITTDKQKLATPDANYDWGICNDGILELATYQCFLKPNGKYKYFKASVFMDEDVKQDLVMEFRKGTNTGEVIKSITLKPGETTDIDMEIGGIKDLCIVSNIRIGHDKVSKLIIGEPIFTNKPQNDTVGNSDSQIAQ